MDDLYAINGAKTEFRECFNLGDTSGSWPLLIQNSLIFPTAHQVNSEEWTGCVEDSISKPI
jgi:hypothetical protein